MKRRFALTVMLIAALTLILVPGADAKRKKADLVLLDANLTGSKHYAFAGEQAEIRTFDFVKNTGKAAADPSKIELTIHEGKSKFSGITRKVGRLKPGETSKGTSTANIDIPSNAKLGEYRAQLCVDARDQVAEEDEADNCDNLGAFYIIAKKWTGKLGGTDETSYTETWTSNDVTFAFAGAADPAGHFDYRLAHAIVSYQASGTYNGCSYTGAGIDTAPRGTLGLFYGAAGGYYVGQVLDKDQWNYPIQVNCNGTFTTDEGPGFPNPLFTNQQGLPFGKATLGGTSGFGTRDNVWNLHP